MKLKVKLFAAAKQIAGQEEIELSVDKSISITELKVKLKEAYPEMEKVLKHARFALNADFVSDQTMVDDTAEIACIPPVSGG